MFGIEPTLDAKVRRARVFYGVIAATTLAGAALSSLGVNPIKALYWTAIVNGVLAAPLMAIMMLIVRNPKAMGELTLPSLSTILGWSATAVMTLATALFFVSLI
jgi:Mn2+/Fe2+ NRAMP family transporter